MATKKEPMNRERILALRIASKCGRSLMPDQMRELERAWRQWPKEYAALDAEVNDAAYEHVTGFKR